LEDFSMSDDILRDTLAAQFRLAMRPETLTAADVDLLGSIRDGLGVRAAICYEVRRALNATKTKTTKTAASRRRTKR
jgi:hypothetical protein